MKTMSVPSKDQAYQKISELIVRFEEQLISYKSSGYNETMTLNGADQEGPLFTESERLKRKKFMEELIFELEQALKTLDKGNPWDSEFKITDECIEPLFRKYSEK